MRASLPNALYMTTNAAQYAAGGAEDDWFFTPALGLRAGQTYRLSFQYRGGGQPPTPTS